MKAMLEPAFKFITLLLLPFLGYGFGTAVWRTVAAAGELPERFYYFAAGAVGFWIFWRLFRNYLEVVCTFEHEVTHLLFALLFLKRPKGFRVTLRDGGHVKLSGSNFVIFLAPYFFPTVSYALLPLALVVPGEWLDVFYGVLGASLAFHLVSTWSELHLRQTDLHSAGLVFSFLFLPVANLIFYGALIVLIFGRTEDLAEFWLTGLGESYGLFTRLLAAAV